LGVIRSVLLVEQRIVRVDKIDFLGKRKVSVGGQLYEPLQSLIVGVGESGPEVLTKPFSIRGCSLFDGLLKSVG
jgi:hypothetical protein